MGINDYIQIGSNIKRLRTQKGYSAKEFSEKINVAYSTYSNYENNNREPNIDTLINIADVLEVTVNELMGVKDEVKIGSNIRKIRKERNMTREEVSNITSIPVETLKFYETGFLTPEDSVEISLLLDAFGLEGISVFTQEWEYNGDVANQNPLKDSLTFALEHAPRDNDKREKEYIERLARIIRVYGEMSQHMHIMALTSSKEKPEEYIRLLQNYEKLQDLIKEHKDDIINGALDWLEDDTKLRALIYGDDPEYKK